MDLEIVVRISGDPDAVRHDLISRGYQIVNIDETTEPIIAPPGPKTSLSFLIPGTPPAHLKALRKEGLDTAQDVQRSAAVDVWWSFHKHDCDYWFKQLIAAMTTTDMTFRDGEKPTSDDLEEMLPHLDRATRLALQRAGVSFGILIELSDVQLGDIRLIREGRIQKIREALKAREASNQ